MNTRVSSIALVLVTAALASLAVSLADIVPTIQPAQAERNDNAFNVCDDNDKPKKCDGDGKKKKSKKKKKRGN